MALVVNTNIASLNAQRNLYGSTDALSKSLERLSSGLRINRAGDDAAGLAISESLRSEIRGLQQAVRNSNDGISLVATAEGAVAEVTNDLQRIRELSIQAANDTNSPQNRASLNLEVEQLIEEIERIANQFEYNGAKLLDGTFIGKKLHVGAQADQTIEINIRDMRGSTLGATAQVDGGAVDTANALADGDMIINGFDVGISADDGITPAAANPSTSAIAKANAINAIYADTGVEALVNENVITGDLAAGIQAINIDGTVNTLTINGIPIIANVAAADSDGALRQAINAVSNTTGVEATVNASGELILTAKDGRNVRVITTGSIADELGLAAANGDIDTIYGAGLTLIADESFSLAGANLTYAGTSLVAGGVAVDLNTAINSVTVTSQSSANTAIRIVDAALRQVNSFRAELGAITNRLEATVSNLQTVTENLSASDSRIRDADYATETAELTRNQILQQAGTAILAQANTTPQAVLTLLQG
ncbi:flagellin [Candidatus Sumerlaeota bacterium]|nr:flagellin [Candidatus Sumerlaeota bacterium]